MLHKDDTSMLAVNAFVTNDWFSFLDLSADEDGIAGSSVVASAFLILCTELPDKLKDNHSII